MPDMRREVSGEGIEVTPHLYARVLHCLESSGYADPMPREIYYSGDAAKPLKAGDKFIQLDWEKTALELTISKGTFCHARKKHHDLSTVMKFSTLKELQQAVGEAIDNALRQGFKRFTSDSGRPKTPPPINGTTTTTC